MTTSRTFPLQGLHCGSCVARVQSRLAEHPLVKDVQVSLQPPQAALVASASLTAAELSTWLAVSGEYRVLEPVAAAPELPEKSASTYRPLLILVGYLVLGCGALLLAMPGCTWHTAMRLFMGGFFVAFSFFKMLDLAGFSRAYRGYDFVAKAWPGYGYVYPFLELGLGLAYLANWHPKLVNGSTAVLMAVSLAGVLHAVRSKQAILCACLGTGFNLPMSTVTIVEDGLMLVMALAMLF
jgi:cation transport ATPase